MTKLTNGLMSIGMMALVASTAACAADDAETTMVRLELSRPGADAEMHQRYVGPTENAVVLRDRLAAQLAGDGTAAETDIAYRVVVEGSDQPALSGVVSLPAEEGEASLAIDALAASLGFTSVDEGQVSEDVSVSEHDLMKICEANACTLMLCECGLKTCLSQCATTYTPPGGCGYVPGCTPHCSVSLFGWCVS